MYCEECDRPSDHPLCNECLRKYSEIADRRTE